MSFFRIHKCYSKRSPNFEKPKLVGYWSLDGAGIVHQDSSQLRYYVPPNNEDVRLNLKENMPEILEKFVYSDDEKLEPILRWLQVNYHKIISTDQNGQKWLQPDFIFNRGVLLKVIPSPWDYRLGWIVCAVKFRGTIYLCQFDTNADALIYANATENDKIKVYIAHKFPLYLTSDSPRAPPDPTIPLDEAGKFYGVFENRLNDHQLLYAAKMEAVDSEEKLEDPLPQKLKFVKFRTSPSRDAIFTTLTSLRWWCQGYVVGADIVWGLKDKDGIVHAVTKESVSDLETNARTFFSGQSWNSAICMNHCNEFLNFVKHTVKEDYDQVVYKFEKNPGNSVEVTELSPKSKYAFLPNWYTSSTV